MTAVTHDTSRRLEHLRSALEQPNASGEVLAALVESLLDLGDRDAKYGQPSIDRSRPACFA